MKTDETRPKLQASSSGEDDLTTHEPLNIHERPQRLPSDVTEDAVFVRVHTLREQIMGTTTTLPYPFLPTCVILLPTLYPLTTPSG